VWSSDGLTYNGGQSLGSFLGEWNKIQFPLPFVLQYLIITARIGHDQAPTEWSIIGSNDDLNWALLVASTEQALDSGITVQVNAGVAYTYFALVIHKTGNNAGGWSTVGELEYYGYVPI